jgi:hypothetical protein
LPFDPTTDLNSKHHRNRNGKEQTAETSIDHKQTTKWLLKTAAGSLMTTEKKHPSELQWKNLWFPLVAMVVPVKAARFALSGGNPLSSFRFSLLF